MESFRSFIEICPYEVEVDLLEHELIGIPQPGDRKYRVSFNAPKTATAAKKGLFDEDILYVVARNPTQAKKAALEWIKYKLEPREGDARPKRAPKHNYLKDIDQKYLDLNARVVGSWSDIVKLLEYISVRKEEPSQFFDDQELEIVLDMMQNKRKNQYLSKLGDKERATLKKVLKSVWQNPGHLAPGLQAVMRIPEDGLGNLHKTITNAPKKAQPAMAVAPPPQRSVYQRDIRSQYDIEDILHKIDSFPGILRAANRLGISKAALEKRYYEDFGHEDEYHAELVKVWKWLYNKIRLSPKAKIFDDDHASKYWDKRGINWERLALGMLELNLTKISGPGGRLPGPSGGFSNYEAMDEYVSWAVPFLWDLYTNGQPKPRMTKVEKYKHILAGMLEEILPQNSTTYKQPAPPSKEYPASWDEPLDTPDNDKGYPDSWDEPLPEEPGSDYSWSDQHDDEEELPF